MDELLKQSVYFLHKLALTVLIISVVTGLMRFKKLDLPSRFFLAFNIASCICELAAYYVFGKGVDVDSIYQIYSLVEFTLISLYFNYSIDVFKSRNIGYYIAGIGILAGIANMIWLQPIKTDNSNFINFEGLFIISMCLFSFVRMMLRDDDCPITATAHFWFTSILAFFWSVTFAVWGVREYFTHNSKETLMGISIFILFVATLSSLFTALTYFRYPRFKKVKELTGKEVPLLKDVFSV